MSTSIKRRVGDEDENPYAPTLAKSDENVQSMWNRSYQSRRLKEGKNYPKDNSFCNHLLRLTCTYLIHLFCLLIILSFAGMAYTVASFNPDEIFDKDVAEQIEREEWYINHNPFIYGLEAELSNTNITQGLVKFAIKSYLDDIRNARVSPDKIPHPLYVELQKRSPFGMMRDYYMHVNDQLTNPIGVQYFYRNYVSQSIPVVLKNEANNWKLKKELDAAIKQGQQNDYLTSMFRSRVQGFDQDVIIGGLIEYQRLTKQKPTGNFTQYSGMGKYMTTDYQTFISESKNMDKKKYLSYIQNLPVASRFPKWGKDDSGNYMWEPSMLNKFLRPVQTKYTQWTDFQRRPVRIEKEQHICVIKGTEKFSLVSPIFRDNLYVGEVPGLRKDDTPLNFFDLNRDKYPLLTQINFLDAILEAGDCVYVPAYFYVQSQTVSDKGNDETIMITQEYLSHSKLVEMITEAVEVHNGIDDDHEWDKKVKQYMDNFY